MRMITEWMPVDSELASVLPEMGPVAERISELATETITINVDKLSVFKAYQRQQKKDASGSISISPVFNGDGSVENFEYSYFIGAFSDVTRYTGNTSGAIIAERFGLGIQIDLKISEVKTAIRGGFGMIAAAVSMDLAEVDYSYHIKALPPGEFYSELPPMGKFDTGAIKKFKQLIAKLKQLYKINSSNQQLAAIEVLVATPLKDTGTEYARDHYFAAKRLTEGFSLADAVKKARENRKPDGSKIFSEDAIQYLYSRMGVTSLDAAPSTTQIAEARKFINLT